MRPAAFITAALISGALAGLASNTSAQTIDMDAVFSGIVPTGPGCAAGLVRSGQPALLAAYGMADLEHPEPLTPASVFESGSVAKQFTAAAILLLVQDGRLTLDDDIRLYLPELPYYGAPVTIRHLLNHTSGLREQWSLLALTGNPPGTQVHTQATILDLASRQKGLNFRPGDEFLYTNTNYALAAVIIARVSGQSLQQFTDQRLFAPLGLSHTRWREDFRTVVPGRATAYAPSGDGFIANMPFTNVIGNGGLLTTIDDLLRWNAFLDHPTDLPGGPDLVVALQTPGRLNDGTTLDYALGLEVIREHGQRLVAHSGSTGGYKTWLGRYPETGLSIAVLCNNAGADPIAFGGMIAAQVLGEADQTEVAESRPARALPADPAPYLGLFRNPVTGELLRTTMAADRLTVTRRGVAQPVTPVGSDTFAQADGVDIRFVMSDGTAAEALLTSAASEVRYVAVAPADADPAGLIDYAGTYYSAELDTRIDVIRRGDSLVMRQAFANEWMLTPSFADAFTTPLRGVTTIIFTRAADGSVDSLRAWANGARDIAFVRQ